MSAPSRARLVLVGLMAAAVALSGAGPATAAESDTGSISGSVTVPEGHLATDVWVSVLTVDGMLAGGTMVEMDGTYVLDNLPAADYVVGFTPWDSGLLTQYWPGVAEQWDATPVTVVAGETLGGIDATMVAAGSVSGVVTSGGLPVEGAWVSLSREMGGGFATTGPDGSYQATGLAPGSYTILVTPPSESGLVPAYWPGTLAVADAGVVDVAAGSVTSGLDLDLELGGVITGTITEATGTPVAFAEVSVSVPGWDGFGSAWGTASTIADEQGRYTLTGVAALPVLLVAYAPDGSAVSQYWPGVRTADEASPLQVSSGGTLEGIDLVLPVAAHVVGTVTLPDWMDYYCVAVDDRAGSYGFGCAQAGEPFDVGGLPAGDYLVWTGSREPGAMLPAFYAPGTMRRTEAVLAHVDAGGTVTANIDASDAFYRGGTEPNVAISMEPAQPTAGAPVTVTVTVSGDSTPEGVAELFLGQRFLTDVELVEGSASVLTSFDAADDGEELSVRYLGDATYVEGYATTTVTLATQQPTTTELASSANPAVQGTPVTLTATVGAVTVPTGTVTFTDGTVVLGSAPLVAGVATLTVSTLAAGTHALTATYGGDPGHLGSAGTVSQVVTAVPAPRVTRISPAVGPVTGGTVVTLRGTGLSGATSVTFDGVAAPHVVVVSEREIRVTTPRGHVGPATVVVRTPGGKSRAVVFVYLPVRHHR